MQKVLAWLGWLGLMGGLLTFAQSEEVVIVLQTGLGDYLADAKEHSLYFYTNDAQDQSNCYDQCARTWPPFIIKGKPVAGKGFGVMDEFYDGALLSTARRKDGSLQVTFNHRPLYFFSGDQVKEQKGQGLGGVWFLASPRGEPIR